MPQPGYQAPLNPVVWKPIFQHQSPRFLIKIDGNTYFGESYVYSQNAHGATDEATIVLPIDGKANFAGVTGGGLASLYPDWTVSIQRSDEAGNAGQPVVAEIWAGYPTNLAGVNQKSLDGLYLRFRGCVDMYSAVLEDNTTTFTCRSLAFPLTSTKIVTPFPREDSVTTIAWIQQQAKRFGLKMAPPKLGNPPVLMIDVLGGEFITGVRGWFIWDLMLQCAQIDDVDLWVDRTGTLHYEAASLVGTPDGQRAKVYYQWGMNCKGLASTHSPQFSKNVRVQVHSWTPRTRTASVTRVQTNPDGGITTNSYTRVVTSTPIFGTTSSLTTSISSNGTVTTSEGTSSGGGASGGTGSENESGIQKYIYFVRNKTLAQCEAMAQQIWRQISMHEYAIKLRAPVTPADLKIMDVEAKIVLDGHPMAAFNSTGKGGQLGYWPREITEYFDPKTGFYWDIDAVNHTLAAGAV
jgi:hypothetical protein